jgi:hypothetical protein
MRTSPRVLLTVATAALLLSGCSGESAERLREPLGAFADRGDTTAMQLVADLELLRATGFLPDSAATAVVDSPASRCLATAGSGTRRNREGEAWRALLEFALIEQALALDGVLPSAERDTLRALALRDPVAAAALATEWKARHAERARGR